VLADLVGKSQSAEGALQAMQAMNQLLALQAKQSIQTQRLQITQDRAASLELARQAAATERGREVTRRFLGEARRTRRSPSISTTADRRPCNARPSCSPSPFMRWCARL
jgi:P-type conjugative transfer protein TrbJ